MAAGAAAPLVIAVGGVFGGAITGAGTQSLEHTVNKRSVVTEECNTKQWLLKAGIGLISGAATGGAAVGITAGVVGLGSSAMESAVVTAGQYRGIRAGTGAVDRAVSSIASDIGRKFVDGEKVSSKQAACRATFGATKRESNPLEDTRIKYISEGAWFSRMIVSFFLNDEKITQQVSGSGKFITIPSPARGIKVKFQVSRPFWGDVMKYDRFKEAWFRPYEPHVFCYDNPTNRTFIVSGNLWWEAVMRVSDEYHEETKEL